MVDDDSTLMEVDLGLRVGRRGVSNLVVGKQQQRQQQVVVVVAVLLLLAFLGCMGFGNNRRASRMPRLLVLADTRRSIGGGGVPAGTDPGAAVVAAVDTGGLRLVYGWESLYGTVGALDLLSYKMRQLTVCYQFLYLKESRSNYRLLQTLWSW